MHIKENGDGIRKSAVAEAGSKVLLFVGIGKTLFLCMDLLECSSQKVADCFSLTI